MTEFAFVATVCWIVVFAAFLWAGVSELLIMIVHDETTKTLAVWVAVNSKVGHPASFAGWGYTRKALRDRFTNDHDMQMEKCGYHAVRATLTYTVVKKKTQAVRKTR